MSRRLAISMAITTQWLSEIGLFSLSKAWKELASKRRTAPAPPASLTTRPDPHAKWFCRYISMWSFVLTNGGVPLQTLSVLSDPGDIFLWGQSF
jgi:hypothetical protein